MRIVSRTNEAATQQERLALIVEAATDGAIAPAVDAPLEELVDHVDNAFMTVLEEMDMIDKECREVIGELNKEMLQVATQCVAQERIIEGLVNGIQYDEALDYATIDLMDAILGTGAADTTYDGELKFDSKVTFSKEDFKPLLRQALETWITLKTS